MNPKKTAKDLTKKILLPSILLSLNILYTEFSFSHSWDMIKINKQLIKWTNHKKTMFPLKFSVGYKYKNLQRANRLMEKIIDTPKE